MKCSKCGYENAGGARFCEECGAPLENVTDTLQSFFEDDTPNVPDTTVETGERVRENDPLNTAQEEGAADHSSGAETSDSGYDEKNGDEDEDGYTSNALENLKKFEEGSITHPNDKPKKKRKFYCPQNPMLWSFLWLLLFGAVLGALSAYFFNVDLDGTQMVFGIAFSVFTAAVLVIDFIYYLPAALTLDRLLKGKGTRLEYRLKKHELVDLAEAAKKRNRGFYLAIGLFGLAFSIYYIYILATAIVKTNLMWISLFFSIGVFVIFALLFFIMPKFNYERMMQNGARVIVGNKSVYYGGTYYHWRKIHPDATFGNLNTKKHKLEIVFTQEQKNGETKRRKVEMYAPDTAIRDITRLLNEYETNSKKYREKQAKKAAASSDKKQK
ncbi:MAG: zinc-ribbon domain-containing protein [Ruminococcaceae bacterium]|nr:zinc-ribbon domain-containing protein [Oscillospiraceae bacterium]